MNPAPAVQRCPRAREGTRVGEVSLCYCQPLSCVSQGWVGTICFPWGDSSSAAPLVALVTLPKPGPLTGSCLSMAAPVIQPAAVPGDVQRWPFPFLLSLEQLIIIYDNISCPANLYEEGSMTGREIAHCQIAFDFFLRPSSLLPGNPVRGGAAGSSSPREIHLLEVLAGGTLGLSLHVPLCPLAVTPPVQSCM